MSPPPPPRRAARARAGAELGLVAAATTVLVGCSAARPTVSGGPTPVPSVVATQPVERHVPAGGLPAPHGVVVLGDSVPSGFACACTTYAALVGHALSDRLRVAVGVANLAFPGATSSSVLAELGQASTRQALAGSDVAIVTVGANDLDPVGVRDPGCSEHDCYNDDLAGVAARLRAILAQLHAAMRHGSAVVVTGYWNVFLDGQVGVAQGPVYVANSDALTRAFNKVVASVAAATRSTYVDLYAPFKAQGDDTTLLAADGDHPNAAGHGVIAEAILRQLL